MFSFLKNNCIEDKILYLKKLNNKREKKKTNCIYGLNNKQFNGYIKIGSTHNPQQRKWDYQTSSPYKYEYLWIYYLDNYNCKLIDDLLKFELRQYNIKGNGGIEFYNIKDYIIISNILNKYKINYRLELGDKYTEKKIDLNTKNNSILENKMNSSDMIKLFNKFTPEQQRKMLESSGINLDIKLDPKYDISKEKYHLVNNRISKFSKIDVNSQSIHFFIKKLQENIKNIIILGLIQSGKTNEIIGMIHYCIVYLKIPVIVLIQNRTSAWQQLNNRLHEFSNKLDNYNIKTRYCKGLREDSIKKIFNFDNPIPEVIICLSNYKQLSRLSDNLEKCTQYINVKLAPYILIMDEYDDHIKSRQDEEDIEKLKVVEKYINYIRDNSFMNVGVTATLLAPMLTDHKTNVKDVFLLKPSNKYVGFGSSRIKIIDIKKDILESKNKRLLHTSKINKIIQNIEESIDYDIKTYSITLVNTSDDTKEHEKIYEELSNEFIEWAVILFNSKNDNSKVSEIRCKLPEETDSLIPIIEGHFDTDGKIKTITKHKYKIPKNHNIYEFLEDEDKYLCRFSISFKNYSVSEIITELMNYTNKVSIVSGRMACRGISFVTDDYKKHITDMIYVPSGSSHLTRNVQDMRIFGNFPNDGIDINLYIDKDNYFTNIGGYINLQNNLLSGNLDDVNYDAKNLRQSIMEYEFNPNEVPEKKLDRVGVVKGINFKPEDKWGIPTHINDFDTCYNELKIKYPDYKIVSYSKHIDLDLHNIHYGRINGKFICPTKSNKLSETYKYLFNNNFNKEIRHVLKSFNGTKLELELKLKLDLLKQSYIYNNFRNGWGLYNPLRNNRDLLDICYMGTEGESPIKLIIKNPSIDKKKLIDTLKKKILIIFYAKNNYHYTKCDKESYYMNDKFFEFSKYI